MQVSVHYKMKQSETGWNYLNKKKKKKKKKKKQQQKNNNIKLRIIIAFTDKHSLTDLKLPF